jgi:peptidoglycan/LPS O-acetylase OafA/YrhL
VKQDQIPSLTGLRFFAAISVVVSHAAIFILPVPSAGWLSNSIYALIISASGFGMPLFFVLSGFVIHYNYSAKIETGNLAEVGRFFIARFARLYPLYIFVLVYSALTSPNIDLSALTYFVPMLQSWLYLVAGSDHVLYALGQPASVSWSVSTEWFFYIAYPAICFAIAALRDERRRFAAAVALIVVAFSLMTLAITHIDFINRVAGYLFGPVASTGPYGQSSFFRWLIYFSPYSRISEFILGCLVASLYLNRRETGKASGLWLTSLALLLIAATYFAFFGLDRFPWFHTLGILHMSFGLAPGIALLIYCCACYENLVTNILAGPWLVLCGEASYSLYLLHIIVVECFTRSNGPPFHSILTLGVCLTACIGVSIVSWRVIEMPARNFVRSWFDGLAKRLSPA